MDGQVIKELKDGLEAPREVNGYILRPSHWLADDPAALIKPGPTAKTLAVSTLGAIRDYLAANRDALDLTKLAVHVESPSSVSVFGPLDSRARVRETFLTAKCSDLTEGFLGRYMPLEDFIVGLQTRFTLTDDRKRVLDLLANVKHETVSQASDDGLTQTVQARAGVVMVREAAVPNPVELVPYRTFRDVTQPASLFALRVQAKEGQLPQVGIFEADGGAWKLVAISRIHDWLTEALKDIAIFA